MTRWSHLAALVAGPALCAAIVLSPTPAGLTPQGQASLAVLVLAVVWWVFTPVALPVTSLVALALLPVLGAMSIPGALALFGNPAVFFVIGVFLVAAVMLHTGLSSRLTLLVLRRLAADEDALCNAVLLLSWGSCVIVVSHAVAALMLPIVLEIIRVLDLGPRSRTARRLLLSMAWGTVAGSNLTLLSSVRASLALELLDGYRTHLGQQGKVLGFIDYSLGSVPLSVATVLVVALVLRRAFPPEGVELTPAVRRLDEKVREMGRTTRKEWLTVATVTMMIACMVVAGPRWLGVVALLFSGVLFALQILQWEDAERYVNWGVALMYGGAIAVGAALHETGATAWLVSQVEPDGVGPWAVLALVATTSLALTEVVSNSAVMAVILPVAFPLAANVGLDPVSLARVVPFAAGFAFVLPTSTPAMAMVFGTGYLQVRSTIVPGLFLHVTCLALLLAVAYLVWPLVGIRVVAGAP